MSERDPDRLLKRVWLINGLLLLALIIVGGGTTALSLARESRGEARAAVSAPAGEATEGSTRPRAVRLGAPQRVRGTDVRLVTVRHGTGFVRHEAERLGSRGQYSGAYEEGPLVNVIFLPPDAMGGQLLFDRPVYIAAMSYPGLPYRDSDTLQTWISYEVVLEDSDNNGRLDDEDRPILFVSDLDGRNLRRVLPDGWHLQSHQGLGDGRTIVVTALRGPTPGARDWKEHEAPERAFLFDVTNGQLRSFSSLDSLATQAATMLGRSPGGRRP